MSRSPDAPRRPAESSAPAAASTPSTFRSASTGATSSADGAAASFPAVAQVIPIGRRRRRWSRGDLPVAAWPDISAADWAADPGGALAKLRDAAEARALITIDWYARDKRSKREFSRLLRAAAVVSAVAGGVLPLISSTASGVNPSLGYVCLAVAAGLVAFDHFFGLSSGWMRCIAAMQALENRLARFQLDWTQWQGEQAGALPTAEPRTPAEHTAAALDLINGLVTNIGEITEAEAARWITEFSTSVATLRQQASPAITSPQDLLTWGEQGNISAG